MIIDSHEHIFSNFNKQIEIMDKGGIDKAVLFSTTIHPENAHNALELESEMNKLTKILSGMLKGEERLKAQRKSNDEVIEAVKSNPDRFMGFGAVPLELEQDHTSEWIKKYIIDSCLSGAGEFTPGSMEAVRNLEPEKCLFSSDAPMGEPDIYRYMLERTIQDKSVLKGVLGENVERILGI